MKLFTKITAGILLGLGLPIILIEATNLANPKSTSDKQVAAIALCLFGLVPSSLGGLLIWNDRRKSEQEEHDRLQSTFFNLLQQGDGRITALGFAMATGLTGALSKAYLDERAKEFSANFDVDDDGNLSYRFNLNGVSLPERNTLQPRFSLPQKRQLAVGKPLAAQGNFDVILEAVPGVHKIAAIKIVRELTGFGLKDAKELVEAAPTPLVVGVSETIAQQCKKKLEAIGAAVMVIEN